MQQNQDVLARLSSASKSLEQGINEMMEGAKESHRNWSRFAQNVFSLLRRDVVNKVMDNARIVLKSITSLMLLEDSINIDSLSWFVKDLSVKITCVNKISGKS